MQRLRQGGRIFGGGGMNEGGGPDEIIESAGSQGG